MFNRDSIVTPCVFLFVLFLLTNCTIEYPNKQEIKQEPRQLLSPSIKLEDYDVLIDGNNVITISTDEECEIYYTLDGSIPSKSNGIQYNPNIPITVESDIVVNAIAVKEGMKDSPISSEQFYQLQAPVIVVYNGNVYMSASSGCDIFYTSSLSSDPNSLHRYISYFNPSGFSGLITYGAIACKNGFINSLPSISTFEKLEPPSVTIVKITAHSEGSSKRVRFNCSKGQIRYTIKNTTGFYTANDGDERVFSNLVKLNCECYMDGMITSDSISRTF